jgi:hypothetical protein
MLFCHKAFRFDRRRLSMQRFPPHSPVALSIVLASNEFRPYFHSAGLQGA